MRSIDNGGVSRPLLRVATVRDDFLIEHPSGKLELAGPMRKLLDILEEKYDYTIAVPKDNEFGVLRNNSWTGMIGMLYRDEADVALALFTTTYERSKVVDYSEVFVMDSTNILSSMSAGSEQEIMDNFKQIGLKVWIALGATILVISFLASFFDYIVENQVTRKKRGIWKKMASNIMVSLAVFLDNDAPFNGKFMSAQIIMCVFWLGLIVVTTMLAGVIQSSFIVATQGIIIDNLEILAKLKGIYPAVFKGTLSEAMFIEAKSGIYKTLADEMRKKAENFVPYDNPFEKAKLYGRIVQRKQALIGTLDLMTMEGKKMCNQYPKSLLHLSKESYFVSKVSITIRKNLRPDMKKTVNDLVRRTFNTGVLTFWLEEVYGNLPVCFQGKQSSDSFNEIGALPIQPLVKVFEVLLAGLLLSAIILVLECIIGRISGQSRRKKGFCCRK